MGNNMLVLFPKYVGFRFILVLFLFAVFPAISGNADSSVPRLKMQMSPVIFSSHNNPNIVFHSASVR